MPDFDFLVKRSALAETKVVERPAREMAEGEVRLTIDAFGFSANNITYAAFGDALGYWDFFPVVGDDDRAEDWGRVPVWGFAEVGESRCADLSVGERVYGYLPMSTDLIVRPGRIRPGSFQDLSPHRSALPGAYNNYTRNSGDPGYDPELESEQMLLRPLFLTSFLIDDFVADQDRFGATTVIVTSASSKTAFGTAHLLSQRDGLTVTGLTSPANVAFVEGLGCYDTVLTYDQVDQLATDEPSILIDFAGNAAVIRAIHARLVDELRHSAIIGGTHWDAAAAGAEPLPGPAQTFFFAPSQIEKRSAEWGSETLFQRIAEAWVPFIATSAGHVTIDERHGADAIDDVYLEQLHGHARPDVGFILHPH